MLLILLTLINVLDGKFVSQTVTISPDAPWRYLSKFAMDIGKGEWSLRLKFFKPVVSDAPSLDLHLSMYLDDDWSVALSAPSCHEKISSVKKDRPISVPVNGDWSAYLEGTLTQHTRPHIWFFVLSDCLGQLSEQTRVISELTIKNTDGSNLSLEERGLVWMLLGLMFAYIFGLSSNMVRLIDDFRKTERVEINLLAVNLAVGSQFSGMCFQVLHLLMSQYYGFGFGFFNYMSQTADFCSQFIISFLFILTSTGWTLQTKEFPDPDTYFPIGMVIVLINMLVIGLGIVTDDAHNKFSEYEGYSGLVQIGSRIGLWLWFLYATNVLQRSASGTKAHYLAYFRMAASIYFLALPLLVLCSWTVVPYYRKQLILIGSLAIQSLALGLVSRLYSDQSTFYKISTMSDSILPSKTR